MKNRRELSSLFTKANYPKIRAKLEEAHLTKAIQQTRERMGTFFEKNQVLGRRASIGCVALEITQRCNLDCSLCYLSEHSEEVKDLPIEEIYRRIDEIKNHFGAGTDVQITGGDPTMRDRKELVAIVKRVRDIGMRPTLMTNGLKASRDLIEELISVGLNDIAFHMDLTFELPGYKTEMDLNKLRLRYIDKVRGL
ncbi:MAG: radical SAM protein, partial [Proteobacteria bacterium]|nr:radical SAM protein [Pseudomonadota bacterium]